MSFPIYAGEDFDRGGLSVLVEVFARHQAILAVGLASPLLESRTRTRLRAEYSGRM
jgi:hypothetical protein